jgi:phosphate:Na+ symporter
MGSIVLGMMRDARKLVLEDKIKYAKIIEKKEATVDQVYAALDDFLKDVGKMNLSDDQSMDLTILIHSVSDIERTSDHINHLARHAEEKISKDLKFSKEAKKELKKIFSKSEESINEALKVLSSKDQKRASKVLHLEAEIDDMKEELIDSHIIRTEQGICDPSSGPTYLSMVSHLERISDHAHNIVNVVKWGF